MAEESNLSEQGHVVSHPCRVGWAGISMRLQSSLSIKSPARRAKSGPPHTALYGSGSGSTLMNSASCVADGLCAVRT